MTGLMTSRTLEPSRVRSGRWTPPSNRPSSFWQIGASHIRLLVVGTPRLHRVRSGLDRYVPAMQETTRDDIARLGKILEVDILAHPMRLRQLDPAVLGRG
jgi:hypothetical protein